MSERIKKGGITIGFTNVPTWRRAYELLKENGITVTVIYSTCEGEVVYFNHGCDTNVATYFPGTGIVTVLRRADYWRDTYNVLWSN